MKKNKTVQSSLCALSLGAVSLGALAFASTTLAQDAPTVTSTTPNSISIESSSAVCSKGSEKQTACITLSNQSTVNKVDIFFLFDDTGSFAGFVPTVTGIFADVVSGLETALPGVDFGYGVGRFEDYGGPGNVFSSENSNGRPFTLNQPIVTAATVGGSSSLQTLIGGALNRTAPGYGGDGPETSISEGLYQVAVGDGFDGDGDSATSGISGTQIAGSLDAQTNPDDSGDVPAFSTLDPSILKSGSVGGAGFRPDALKIVIVATDICSVAAFARDLGIPSSIAGSNGVTESVSEFACETTEAGQARFGFVGASKSVSNGSDEVAPLGAHTVAQTIAALNAAGIRVLGMVPGGDQGEGESVSAKVTTAGLGTPSGSGPSYEPAVFLSALARLTGGVDADGNPLVFGIGSGSQVLKDNIVSAVAAAAAKPLNISVNAKNYSVETEALSVSPTPEVVSQVKPGDQACFDVSFTGSGLDFTLGFNLNFFDVDSGVSLAQIPTSVNCASNTVECSTVNIAGDQNALDGGANQLKNQVNKAANRLVQIGGRSQKSLARSLKSDASKLYSEAWSLVYTVPGAVQTCTESNLCVKTSNQPLITNYSSKSAALKALVEKAVKRLKKIGNSTKDSNSRLKNAASQHNANLSVLSNIPVETSSCSSD